MSKKLRLLLAAAGDARDELNRLHPTRRYTANGKAYQDCACHVETVKKALATAIDAHKPDQHSERVTEMPQRKEKARWFAWVISAVFITFVLLASTHISLAIMDAMK